MGKVVATNRKAYHDFFVEETYEAGLSLTGTEVKSLRAGKAGLRDSYARIRDDEVYLENVYIARYDQGGINNHEPYRSRKLLLHKREIRRLVGKVHERGFTLVPLKIYFSKGRAKVELGLAKGKRLYDKRQTLAEKTAQREMERDIRDAEKGTDRKAR